MPAEQQVIDHIVVTAKDLDTGVAYVRERLGFAPQGGGEHPKMGTHNRLLRCGPSCYLEVIAINPQAPAPSRPRWFGLDTMNPKAEASLAAWVVRTTDIHHVATASAQSLGTVTPMQRGELDWLITIPETGLSPLDGLAPALIEWHTATLPVISMPDQGLSLEALHIYHSQSEQMLALIESLNLRAPLTVMPCPPGTAPFLKAIIRTPDGLRELT